MHANASPILPAIYELPGAIPEDMMFKLSMIPLPSRRMIALFLGEKTQAVSFNVPLLVQKLMAQCLEGYAKSCGGRIAYATEFTERPETGETTPTYVSIHLDGKTHRFLTDGHLFIEIPGGRVVVFLKMSYFGGGDVACTIEVHSASDAVGFFEQWKTYSKRHHFFRGRAGFPTGDLVHHSRQYDWDDVVLAEDVRATLQTHVHGFLSRAGQLRRAGMKGRRGLLLSGPPGTGKTLLGKVLAGTLGRTFGTSFLWVLPRHIKSAACIEDLLSAARFLSPAVLFLEDLDLFGEDRDTSRSMILGELMNQLDGVGENDGLVTIATTNRLEVIQRACESARPIQPAITLGPPDKACRERLLDRLLKGSAMVGSERQRVVRLTEGFTPAQLEELVNTMHMLAAEVRDSTAAGAEMLQIGPA